MTLSLSLSLFSLSLSLCVYLCVSVSVFLRLRGGTDRRWSVANRQPWKQARYSSAVADYLLCASVSYII